MFQVQINKFDLCACFSKDLFILLRRPRYLDLKYVLVSFYLLLLRSRQSQVVGSKEIYTNICSYSQCLVKTRNLVYEKLNVYNCILYNHPHKSQMLEFKIKLLDAYTVKKYFVSQNLSIYIYYSILKGKILHAPHHKKYLFEAGQHRNILYCCFVCFSFDSLCLDVKWMTIQAKNTKIYNLNSKYTHVGDFLLNQPHSYNNEKLIYIFFILENHHPLTSVK